MDAPTFRPLRPASPARRVIVLIAGPSLWVIALAILAWVVEQGNAVGIGLLVACASLLLGFVYLLPQRRLRDRRER